MSARLGYNSLVKTDGTPTAFTAAATTALADDSLGRKRRQITNAAQRVIDPRQAVTVKDGGVAVAAANYVVDYLTGIITFLVAPAGVITVDGTYIPLLTISAARTSNVERTAEMLDVTTFESAQANGGARSYLPGVHGASGDLELVDVEDVDIDSGAGTKVLVDHIVNRSALFLEIKLADTGYYARGWVHLSSKSQTAPAAEALTGSLNWTATTLVGNGRTDTAAFSVSQ